MKANVQISNTGNKNRHNLTHQVSTSADYGFCQPIMCNEVEPGSTSNFSIGQAVFASPLVRPTFGKVTLNTYTAFVPAEDI